jgi:hypothetical protein
MEPLWVDPRLKESCAPDERERVIQACYELVCAGRPLSEILDEVKRLSDLGKGSKLDFTGEPGNAQGAGDARSHDDAQSESRIAQLPEPTPSGVVDHSREFLAPLAAYSGSDATHGPDALNIQQSLGLASVVQAGLMRLCRLIGSVSFWLVTAICLAALATTAGIAVVANLPTATKATSPIITPPIAERRPSITPSSESTAERGPAITTSPESTARSPPAVTPSLEHRVLRPKSKTSQNQ